MPNARLASVLVAILSQLQQQAEIPITIQDIKML
jgi:hypothetical protein